MLKTVNEDIENMVKIQRILQYLTRLSQHNHVMAKRFHFEVQNETAFNFKNGPTFFTRSKLNMYCALQLCYIFQGVIFFSKQMKRRCRLVMLSHHNADRSMELL